MKIKYRIMKLTDHQEWYGIIAFHSKHLEGGMEQIATRDYDSKAKAKKGTLKLLAKLGHACAEEYK